MNSQLNCHSRSPFFARQSPEEFEKQWEQLMEQQYQLKKHGNYSLFEQDEMTAEERAWVMKRINRDLKEQQERERTQMGSIKRPSMPSMPRRR